MPVFSKRVTINASVERDFSGRHEIGTKVGLITGAVRDQQSVPS